MRHWNNGETNDSYIVSILVAKGTKETKSFVEVVSHVMNII